MSAESQRNQATSQLTIQRHTRGGDDLVNQIGDGGKVLKFTHGDRLVDQSETVQSKVEASYDVGGGGSCGPKLEGGWLRWYQTCGILIWQEIHCRVVGMYLFYNVHLEG